MRCVFGALALSLLAVACTAPEDAVPRLRPGEVTIHRDEWNVPHIYATAEENGFYGLGYAMADDQLERILRMVIGARGTSAQLLGAQLEDAGPAADLTYIDYIARLWRIHEVAEASVPRLDPQLRTNYERYAAGIVAFMEDHPDETPDWAPRDLSVADMIAMPRFGLWSFYQAGIGIGDCRRAGIDVPQRIPQVGPGTASNVWAVMPERTATGGAILLTDPHGGIDGRFSYEYRLHAGSLRSTGYSFGPMMIVARNQHVGWGLTTGSPDVADCFVVETDPDDPRRFQFDGQWQQMETQEITIDVKDADPITLTAEYTRHNGLLSPVIARDGTRAYIVSTAYMDDAAAFHNTIYRMNLAANVDDVHAALANNGMFPQNVLAADTAGDLLFVHAGKTPIRPDPDIDWQQPVDGNTSATAWQGIHPLDDLVVIRSPAAGYLQNNNVDPALMAHPTPAEVAGKPAYLLNAGIIPAGRVGDRSERALKLLAQHDAMTREQASAVVFDTKLPGTDAWIDVLRRATAAVAGGVPEHDAAFVDELLAFDGRLEADSTAALKYVYWREALGGQLQPPAFQQLMGPLWNGEPLPDELAAPLVAAVGRARESLESTHGDLATPFGTEFRIGGDDGASWPLSGGTVGVGPECGLDPMMCPISLLAYWYGPASDGQRVAVGGSRLRRLDFFGPDGIESFTAQNPGHSDDPTSGHTDDQAEKLASTGQMKPVHFDWADLEPAIRSTVTLTVDANGRGRQTP